MQTLLYHSALGSASPRSPPVSPAGGCASLGCHAGRTGTLAPAPSGRAGPGKTVAGTAPRGALHVWPACGSSCHPATAHRPSRREVTQRQKCALFFLAVAVEVLESRIAFVEGRWTPLPQMPKRSGLVSQGTRVTQKEG